MLSKKRFITYLQYAASLSFILCLAGCAGRQYIAPPAAKVIAKADTLHGDTRIDNYYWLREKSKPEVIKYLEAENKYTKAMMRHTEKFQEQLYKELLSRIKETDLSVPEKIDDYYYYSRTEEGKQYSINCRKKASLEAKEEILLDQNALALGHDYFKIGVFRISPDHRFLAYSVDTNGGSETYTLYVKDLISGELLEDKVPNTGYSVEWASDNKTIFYNVFDKAKRPYQLYRHELGSDPENDVLVYHEKDDDFVLFLHKTKSKAYLLIFLIRSGVATEYRYLRADCPTANFKVVHPRQDGLIYYVYHNGDKFFIRTFDDNAPTVKLMEAPVKDLSKKNWTEVIPHRDSLGIWPIQVFKNHLVGYESKNKLTKIRVHNLTNNEIHYVDFDEPIYSLWTVRNQDFDSNQLRFEYTSFVTPRSVFDYDMNIKTLELKKQDEILGYDPALYQSERIFAKASDGTMVPISLVYKKGIVKDGRNPLLLYGYGSSNATIKPSFSSDRLSLLDRGFIYAIAHVYNGIEGLKKKNTFTEFIACAEHLIAKKYTSSDKIVIYGESAGGLLMGAVTNMRPDLFKIVVAKVPWVDLLSEPRKFDKEYYDYCKTYSPYDNVEAKKYPSILITAGLNDPRVQYWEPAKWTAKLRALKTDENILLLKTKMGAGHGGASGRYDYLKDIAFEYAFIFDLFGIEK